MCNSKLPVRPPTPKCIIASSPNLLNDPTRIANRHHPRTSSLTPRADPSRAGPCVHHDNRPYPPARAVIVTVPLSLQSRKWHRPRSRSLYRLAPARTRSDSAAVCLIIEGRARGRQGFQVMGGDNAPTRYRELCSLVGLAADGMLVLIFLPANWCTSVDWADWFSRKAERSESPSQDVRCTS